MTESKRQGKESAGDDIKLTIHNLSRKLSHVNERKIRCSYMHQLASWAAQLAAGDGSELIALIAKHIKPRPNKVGDAARRKEVTEKTVSELKALFGRLTDQYSNASGGAKAFRTDLLGGLKNLAASEHSGEVC